MAGAPVPSAGCPLAPACKTAQVTEIPHAPNEPIVAVIIPALNEAGKIGRVLDKLPSDGWFEAIVVDDGSTDGTGDEARAHGAAVVIRHDVRGGVGAAIRDGWQEGLARERQYLALLSGDDQHEPAELITALDALLEAAEADYAPGLALAEGRPRRRARPAAAASGTRLYSVVFTVLVLPPRDRRDERLPDLQGRDPARPEDRPRPGLARRATTSSRTCCTRRSGAATR